MEKVEKSISSADTWTDKIEPARYSGPTQGKLAMSISGTTWSATVTLQRSFDEGSNWHEVNTYTSNTQKTIDDPLSGVVYRIGVASGNYTSGTVTVGLYK